MPTTSTLEVLAHLLPTAVWTHISHLPSNTWQKALRPACCCCSCLPRYAVWPLMHLLPWPLQLLVAECHICGPCR